MKEICWRYVNIRNHSYKYGCIVLYIYTYTFTYKYIHSVINLPSICMVLYIQYNIRYCIVYHQAPKSLQSKIQHMELNGNWGGRQERYRDGKNIHSFRCSMSVEEWGLRMVLRRKLKKMSIIQIVYSSKHKGRMGKIVESFWGSKKFWTMIKLG